MWKRFLHPEGTTYYICLERRYIAVILGCFLEDRDTTSVILDAATQAFEAKAQALCIRLPNDAEIVFEVSAECSTSINNIVHYYIVDHDKQAICWLHDITPDDAQQLGLIWPDAVAGSESHKCEDEKCTQTKLTALRSDTQKHVQLPLSLISSPSPSSRRGSMDHRTVNLPFLR